MYVDELDWIGLDWRCRCRVAGDACEGMRKDSVCKRRVSRGGPRQVSLCSVVPCVCLPNNAADLSSYCPCVLVFLLMFVCRVPSMTTTTTMQRPSVLYTP